MKSTSFGSVGRLDSASDSVIVVMLQPLFVVAVAVATVVVVRVVAIVVVAELRRNRQRL